MQRQRSPRLNSVTEGAAFQVLHRDEMAPIRLAEVVYGYDIGMLELAGGAGFTIESLDALALCLSGQVGRQAQLLDSEPASHRLVDRLVDHVIRPGDLPDDPISIGNDIG